MERFDVFGVLFVKNSPFAIEPRYAYPDDACADLFTPDEIKLGPGDTCKVDIGIAIKVPKGFEARIRGRSGLASKGIQVHHGTIDEGYTGNLGIMLTNTNPLCFTIKAGKAIAQLSISPVYRMHFIETESLACTERGDKGFGSSG